MQIKTTMTYQLTPYHLTHSDHLSQNGYYQKENNNKCWKGCREKRIGCTVHVGM